MTTRDNRFAKLILRQPQVQRTSASTRASSWLLILSALFAVLPFLLKGPACGADFIFHFTSWHDVLRAWQNGNFYPFWASSPNFLAGEPRFVFYPPISWMTGALLGALIPWPLVPAAFSFAILLGIAFATRALAREVLPERTATLAGCAGIYNGYTLFELYHHSDFSLIMGGFCIPLLLLAFFRQQSDRHPHPLKSRWTLILGLLLAATWLCNTPLGLMATYMLLTMGLLASVQHRSLRPMLSVCLAIALGLGLAGFYLLPALQEQRFVDIHQLFSNPEHRIENRWITSELRKPYDKTRGFIEATVLVTATLCMVIVAFRRRVLSEWGKQRQYWLSLSAILVGSAFLFFPISLPLWNYVPRLRFLQYPWRWLVVMQAPTAVYLATAVESLGRYRRYALFLCALAFVLVVLRCIAGDTFFQACSVRQTGPLSLNAIVDALKPGAEGVGGFEEYTSPVGARNELIAAGMPLACLLHDPLASISSTPAQRKAAYYGPQQWSPALGTCLQQVSSSPVKNAAQHLRFSLQVPATEFLLIRLRKYPSWHVSVNGQAVGNLPMRADGLLVVPVPPGRDNLAVDWISPWDVVVGRAISMATLLSMVSLWLWSDHRFWHRKPVVDCSFDRN